MSDSKEIYQYDLAMKDDRGQSETDFPKGKTREIFERLVKKFNSEFGRFPLAYDGSKVIFSPEELPVGSSKSYEVDIPGRKEGETDVITVSVQPTGVRKLADITRFIQVSFFYVHLDPGSGDSHMFYSHSFLT